MQTSNFETSVRPETSERPRSRRTGSGPPRQPSVLGRQPSSLASCAVFVGAAALLSCAVAPPPAGELPSPYRILVTNDDGIESPGVQVLAEELRKIGEVTLVAPCGERSGSSMSVLLATQVRLRSYGADNESGGGQAESGAGDQQGAEMESAAADPAEDYEAGAQGGLSGRCVDNTPAGAVLFALNQLAPESGFDVVVSGINRGANVGSVSHMSGTVGAAMMAAYHGIPAVAASLGDMSDGFGYSARVVARFVSELGRRQPEPGVVYSINLPKGTAAETNGVEIRPMGGSFLKIEYEEFAAPDGEASADGERLFIPRFVDADPYPAGSDSEAYSEDYVTITPLRFDWTDGASLRMLMGWDLTELAEETP